MRRQAFRVGITQPFTLVTRCLDHNYDDYDCRSKQYLSTITRERLKGTIS